MGGVDGVLSYKSIKIQDMITMNLLNRKWYRNLFSNRTFVKCDGKWIDYNDYKGGKVTDVDGKWNMMAFCECGNVLTHSSSFFEERLKKGNYVYSYQCSNCLKIQHFNPDIVPGLIRCDEDGKPI